MTTIFAVDYTLKQWYGKPDPNGIGKCTVAFFSLDEANRAIEKLKAKNHRHIQLRIIEQ